MTKLIRLCLLLSVASFSHPGYSAVIKYKCDGATGGNSDTAKKIRVKLITDNNNYFSKLTANKVDFDLNPKVLTYLVTDSGKQYEYTAESRAGKYANLTINEAMNFISFTLTDIKGKITDTSYIAECVKK